MLAEKVVSFDLVSGSLIADIVETSKTSAINVVYAMIRYKKVLLPTHIDKVFIIRVVAESIVIKVLCVFLKRWESFL